MPLECLQSVVYNLEPKLIKFIDQNIIEGHDHIFCCELKPVNFMKQE